MPEHDDPAHEDPAPPLPRTDPTAVTPGGPGKTVAAMPAEFTERLRERAEADGGVLLPGGTYEEADMARAALAALRGWAARRERLSADRADLMAAAWWSGHRNVTELARSADVSRDTAYADLRSRGIEPRDKAAAAVDPRPRYAPLTADAVHELGLLMDSVARPAILTDDPGPLAQAAWDLTTAVFRIGELLDEDSDAHRRWGRDELAHDLVDRLRDVLEHAQAYAADGVSVEQLAGRALARISDQLADEQWVVEDATVRLTHLNGDRVEVRIRQAEHRDLVPAGWTLLDTNRPLGELAGTEHLAIRTALDTIAETLTRPLANDEEHTEVEAAE
ncbi:hypothetical protein ACFW2D_17630 [Streptomyces sp. NPDC058914]|uniref:hypothetical protein n=1 Tax=Streptomyces sp. NPDC058914 TaxID=3346671 RepID=UPI0036C69048